MCSIFSFRTRQSSEGTENSPFFNSEVETTPKLFFSYSVVAFSRQHFLQTNGYSNSFFGWGGEDDDLYYRVRQARLDPVRFEPAIARYKMLSHNRETPNPDRFSVMKKGRRKYSVDGLADLNYTLVTHQVKPLYTWILVHL